MENFDEKRGKNKLNVIAITDLSVHGEMAVRYGAVLAAIFKTSLTIITNFSFQRHPSSTNIQQGNPQNEQELLRSMQHYLNHNIETFLLSEHYSAEKLYEFAEETGAILFVIGVEKNGVNTFFNRKKAIKFIKPSRIPVMVVGNSTPDTTVFQHVMLPIDIERQAKEKALWAGYFSRFYYAKIHVLTPTYKDEFLKKKIKDNIDFIAKLYHNLNVDYQVHELPKSIDNVDKFSLQHASLYEASLTVVMMTKYYSIGDILLGPKENSLIGNSENLPVLCLNERDDLYVLCT